MAGKRKEIVDIYALLQHLRAGESNRRIQRELGIDRRTAQKYRAWAEEYGLLGGTLPPIEELYQLVEETMPTAQPPQSQSSVEPYRQLVRKLREQGVVSMAGKNPPILAGKISPAHLFGSSVRPPFPAQLAR